MQARSASLRIARAICFFLRTLSIPHLRQLRLARARWGCRARETVPVPRAVELERRHAVRRPPGARSAPRTAWRLSSSIARRHRAGHLAPATRRAPDERTNPTPPPPPLLQRNVPVLPARPRLEL